MLGLPEVQALQGHLLQPLLYSAIWLKALVLLLVLLNIKSFPGVWHWYVLRPAVWIRLGARASWHPLLPWIPASKKVATNSVGTSALLRLDALPIGGDLFHVSTHRFRCFFDDADFNLHMSNSSYVKITDYVRYSHLFHGFIASYYDGAWMAVGGQTLNYPREIPLFAKYETKFSVATWDSKWLYVIVKFVSPRKKSRKQSNSATADVSSSGNESASRGLKKPVGLFSDEDLGSRTLYATSVSRFCFKAGRKTIPPWFIIATSGHGKYVESARSNWEQAETLRRSVHTKAQAEYRLKKGKALPRELGAYRKFGLLMQYDPARPEGAGKSDERGLGVYQDKSSWDMSEWEERKLQGMEEVRALGVSLPAPGASLA